jgi:hypothetical protein
MPVETRSYVDQEIRTLVDGFAKAVREKNLDVLMPLSKAASTTKSGSSPSSATTMSRSRTA